MSKITSKKSHSFVRRIDKEGNEVRIHIRWARGFYYGTCSCGAKVNSPELLNQHIKKTYLKRGKK